MSKKLIDERAILLFPSLAKSIGLNNSIFIQQLHFWCDIADELGYGKLHDGERWVYKTAQEWHEKDFPFWSVVTIRRIINNLHDLGLIHAMYLDDDKWNRTLFYRINYLHESLACDQNDHMQVINLITSKSSNRSHASDQSDEMLSENTTEITSKITTDISNNRKSKFNPKEMELPSNVDFDLWCQFVDMRSEIKKKLPERSAKMIISELKSFGITANESLKNAITATWLKPYPVKQSNGFNQQPNNTFNKLGQLADEWDRNNADYTPY